MSVETKSHKHSDHTAEFAALAKFPLLEAMFGRRARRFGRGMTIPDGPLAYASKESPQPLCETETMLLVLTGAGITGFNYGIPHTPTGAPQSGCNYPVRNVGRTYASAAGIEASELMWTDDSGGYITQFRDLPPETLAEFRQTTDLGKLIEMTQKHIVRLTDKRVELPQAFPHIESHNFWVANRPGSTLFFPIVDLAQQFIAFLSILLGERALPFDTQHDRPCGDLDPFIRSGLIDPERKVPLPDFEQYLLGSGAAEVSIANHNIVLMLQAMGLGGWFYSGLNPASLLGASAAEGIPGFGFRTTMRPEWSGPNVVGLDKYFEGYCPPFYPNMRAAVARFIERKFGAGGTYDPATGGPYRNSAEVKSRTHRYSPEFVECLSVIAEYIHDTYGKFPSSVPSIFVRFYAQAHHLDLSFYDEHFGPEAYLPTHREHQHRWHAGE